MTTLPVWSALAALIAGYLMFAAGLSKSKLVWRRRCRFCGRPIVGRHNCPVVRHR
jgi:hypothetical protein